MGSLAIILHAHLPFVRHPEYEDFLEENWLFDAITETYIPLLTMMERLLSDGVTFKLAMSVTPPLCAMLGDELLRDRYVKRLEFLIRLCEREVERNRADELRTNLAKFYLDFFTSSRRRFVDDWQCDLLKVFARMRDAGVLELIGCAATHGLLPLLYEQSPESARAQLFIGRDVFEKTFGQSPAGWWLPECAYSPKLNTLLQETNARWFVLDAHGIMHADPRPRRAVYAPYFIPTGSAAYARDPETSRQVWSARGGYPGDFFYREFHQEAMFDRSGEVAEKGSRFAGLKYFRITGPADAKELYDRAAALEAAERHARHFVQEREHQLRQLSGADFEPVVVAPFDAELFGHWWFEGPQFLESFIRLAASSENFSLVSPSEFLQEHPTQQILQPAASSWGEKGYLGVWLDPRNAWIYPLLHQAAREMTDCARKHTGNDKPLIDRFLKQMARELLLAQSSDWAFLIKNGTAREYATGRTRQHLARFDQLRLDLEAGARDESFLADCEWRDNLFPDLNWRFYI